MDTRQCRSFVKFTDINILPRLLNGAGFSSAVRGRLNDWIRPTVIGFLFCAWIIFCAACVPLTAQPTVTPGNEITVEILKENAVERPASNETISTVGVDRWVMEVLGETSFEGYAVAGINKANELVTLFVFDQTVPEQTTFYYLLPDPEADAARFREAFMRDACEWAETVPSSIYTCKKTLTSGHLENTLVSLLKKPTEGNSQKCEVRLALCDDYLELISQGTGGVRSTGWNYVKTYCTPEYLREVCPPLDVSSESGVDIAWYLISAGKVIWDHCIWHRTDPWCKALCAAGTFRNGDWCPTPQAPEAEPTASHGGEPYTKTNKPAMEPFKNADTFGTGGSCKIIGWAEWTVDIPEGYEIHAKKVCLEP